MSDLENLQRLLWIKVTKNNLPPENHPVFVYVKLPGMYLESTDYILNGKWHRWSPGGVRGGQITYYMEFPLPPFSESEKRLEKQIKTDFKEMIDVYKKEMKEWRKNEFVGR